MQDSSQTDGLRSVSRKSPTCPHHWCEGVSADTAPQSAHRPQAHTEESMSLLKERGRELERFDGLSLIYWYVNKRVCVRHGLESGRFAPLLCAEYGRRRARLRCVQSHTGTNASLKCEDSSDSFVLCSYNITDRASDFKVNLNFQQYIPDKVARTWKASFEVKVTDLSGAKKAR